MGTISTTALKTQAAAVVALVPLTVTIGSTDYVGARSVLRKVRDVLPAGQADEYEFSVTIGRSALTTLPAPRSLVTIGGTQYRIVQIEQDAADVTVRLHLGRYHV